MSTLLAEAGIQGFRAPFEGRAGFFALFAGGRFEPRELLDDLGHAIPRRATQLQAMAQLPGNACGDRGSVVDTRSAGIRRFTGGSRDSAGRRGAGDARRAAATQARAGNGHRCEVQPPLHRGHGVAEGEGDAGELRGFRAGRRGGARDGEACCLRRASAVRVRLPPASSCASAMAGLSSTALPTPGARPPARSRTRPSWTSSSIVPVAPRRRFHRRRPALWRPGSWRWRTNRTPGQYSPRPAGTP